MCNHWRLWSDRSDEYYSETFFFSYQNVSSGYWLEFSSSHGDSNVYPQDVSVQKKILNKCQSYRLIWSYDNTQKEEPVYLVPICSLFIAPDKREGGEGLFFFYIWVLWPFQEYFTYIEVIVHQRWAKTREPGGKIPDHPQAELGFPTCDRRGGSI